jgi:hypothetical protein
MDTQSEYKVADNTHRASEITMTSTSDTAPRYKNESEDLEKDVDRKERKLADTSSFDSPQKSGRAEELDVDEDELEPSAFTRYWRKYRPFGHGIIWLLVTAYDPLKRD